MKTNRPVGGIDEEIDYDNIRMENQNKTIMELQNEIKEYQKKERAFLVHLHLKDKEIRVLQNNIKDLLKKIHDQSQENKTDIYLDPLVLNEFRILKNLLREKDEQLQLKDEELSSLQVTQNKYLFIKKSSI